MPRFRFCWLVLALGVLLATGCDGPGEIPGDDGVADDDAGDDDTGDDDAGDDDTADDDTGDDDAGDDDTLPPLDLQGDLDATVAENAGWGGGVFRVTTVDGALWWEGASGDAVRQPPTALTPADTFEIASTSKAFTAALVLLLVDDGALGLDDPIGDLLPPAITTGLLVIDNHDYGPELTVHQLLGHTSGLPDYWNDPPHGAPGVNAFLQAYIDDPDRYWEPEELIEYAKLLDPIDVPGGSWHYGDTGYVLAGLIVEALTGQELHQVYRERLFEPLGLQDTYLTYRELPVYGGTESHRYEWHWDMHGKVHNSADWAGGGLVSSTRDLAAFLGALARRELFVDPAISDQMEDFIATGQFGVRYGLGLFWTVLPDELGSMWGHDGYGNSWMYYWGEEQVLFTGTLNQTEADWWPLVVAATAQIDAVR